MIREDAETIRRSLARRRTEAPLDEAIEADEQRRGVLVELEELRAERNQAGRAIGQARDNEERQRLIAAQRASATRIDELEEQLRAVESSMNALLSEIPNVVGDETPDGDDEESNVVVREWGERRAFDFDPKPHWEIGEQLGIIDIERAAAMSGSRMYALRGAGARLQRALIGWFLDCHGEAGYEECYVPAMVREDAMRASGQLPKFRDNLYRDEEEDYYFVPTAEVPLTNMHADEILAEDQLPIRYAAHTPCFRREKRRAPDATCAGSNECISLRKLRCINSRRRRTSAARRSMRCWPRRSRCCRAWSSSTASSRFAAATSDSTPRSATTSRSGRPVRKSGWKCPASPIAPTSRRGARTSAIGPTKRRARGSCIP